MLTITVWSCCLKPSFAASGDYDHGAIPSAIWLSGTDASQCLNIPTFPSDNAEPPGQFRILVMPGNLTIVVTILKQCVEGTVRLGDGNAGRLEVCLHGMYGTVCNTTWTKHNTHVVCNQLGFSGQGTGRDTHGLVTAIILVNTVRWGCHEYPWRGVWTRWSELYGQ